jgi:hypothetical protein
MKTLYNSLKPEYIDMIEAQSNEYPASVRSIKKSLTNNCLWSHLTISQVRDFMAFANTSSSEVSYMDWAFGKRFLQCED